MNINCWVLFVCLVENSLLHVVCPTKFYEIKIIHPFVYGGQPCKSQWRPCMLVNFYWNCWKTSNNDPLDQSLKRRKFWRGWYWMGCCWTNNEWIITLYNTNGAVGDSAFKIHHCPNKKCGENMMKTCHQQTWEKTQKYFTIKLVITL